MTYKFYTTKERLEFIEQHQLKTNVLKTTNDSVYIEIEIKDNLDIVNLFHAGIMYGLNSGLFPNKH